MLTDEKKSHLCHMLLKGLLDKDLIDIRDEEGKVRKQMKRSLESFLKASEAIDVSVRKKLQSYSRKIVEGSPEWEVLYKKFYKEEAARKGMADE